MGRPPNPGAPFSKVRARSVRAVVLPSQGCDLPAPRLPGGRKWSAAERRAWKELWESPQATQWDDSFALAVAMYVVHSSAVLAGEAAAWQATEARHLADQLGLTARGLQALGWRVAEPGESATVIPMRDAR